MSEIKIEPMSIDQLAGSFVLIMGAIGSLLLVVWQSRCECDLNLCYIIRCHRKPPPDEKIKKDKDKKDKEKGVLKDTEKGEEEDLIPQSSNQSEPEPEPEPL
jgi:hypothetical protein|tara:strand:+ start:148 stop:453 length:306 start_codon:yes stop_codon:yes gene_type:complete